MKTPEILPKGTTPEQWDAYQIDLERWYGLSYASSMGEPQPEPPKPTEEPLTEIEIMVSTIITETCTHWIVADKKECDAVTKGLAEKLEGIIKSEVKELRSIIALNFRMNMPEPKFPTGERKAYDGLVEHFDNRMKWYDKAKEIEKQESKKSI